MDRFKYVVDKFGLNVNRHHWVNIRDFGRDDFAKLLPELGLNKGVEVGTWKGEYAKTLCEANPNIELFCVDPYIYSAYEPKEQEMALKSSQREFNSIYRTAVRELMPYNCTVIREFSMNALRHFEDESLDFVYIDANHSFPNFINDIHYWLKKVKIGGIMSGHDWVYMSYKRHHHVKRALIAYARSYRMIPLFICGEDNYEKGIARDKYRSWFWIKDK